MKKLVSGTLLVLLLAGFFVAALDAQPISVKADSREKLAQAESGDARGRLGSQVLTPHGEVPELSWTQGKPFPVINGCVMYPTGFLAPQVGTHWYAGSVYPWELATQNASSVSMSIRVPSSLPRSDEFYYVLLSVFDSYGSYDQVGFTDCYGVWGLCYSWTTYAGGVFTYLYSPSAMVLSLGATYTFNISTAGGITCFTANQGAVQVWSLSASTGGNYLVVSASYAGYYDYTDYEEVWQTATPVGSPAFDFYFYNNYWTSINGTRYAAAWEFWNSCDYWPFTAPQDVDVIISGDSVLIKNPGAWWPMFHHDLWHNGYSTSTAPSTNQTLWNSTISGGAGVTSSPAVAGGLVYVGSVYPGHNVYCWNATTGALKWSYTTGDEVESSPAVVDGLVYVGSNDGKVYCLNASATPMTASKRLIWSYTTGNAVFSSPAVIGGLVYVGSDDYKVYCLNASATPMTASQRLIWNYTTGDHVPSSPAVAGGLVYVGSDDYNIYCLNATNGRLVWRYTPVGSELISSPAVAGGLVYVGSFDGKVYCLNASTGAFVWSYKTGGSVYSSPAVVNGVVYVGSEDGKVYAFGPALKPSLGTVYIEPNGSISPLTAPIRNIGNVIYTFTDNLYAFIIVLRNNIIINGAGYTDRGAGNGTGILVSERSNVTVKNITIEAFDNGVILNSSSSCTISQNNITRDGIGVYLEHSNHDTLSGNNITNNNADGAYLYSSSNCTLSGNTITNNGVNGAYLYSSSNCTLSGNNISTNWYPVVLDYSCNHCTLSENTITNNSFGGVYLVSSSDYNAFSGNNVRNNCWGFWLDTSSDYNTFLHNYMTANGDGIDLYSSSNNTVTENNISNSTYYGVYLYSSSYCTLMENNIINNTNGIALQYSSTNTICHNNFINNTLQVSSDGSPNTWDKGYPSGGNYWSDCQTRYPSATEIDGSGIWNTPYVVDANNIDHYPLMKALAVGASIHCVAITKALPSKTIVGVGLECSVIVTVANEGSYTETFTVTAYANTTAIETQTVTLVVGTSAPVTLTWNTTGFAYGNYSLSAIVTLAPGETNQWTGPFTYGTVKVTIPGDVNGDGVINILDVSVIAAYWLQTVPPAPSNADVNCDGVINILDVSVCAAHWLQTLP